MNPRFLSLALLSMFGASCGPLARTEIPYLHRPDPNRLTGFYEPSPADPDPEHPLREVSVSAEGKSGTVAVHAHITGGEEELDGGGSGKMTRSGMLRFDFTDSYGNRGLGTFRRANKAFEINITITEVGDARCLPYYGRKILRRNTPPHPMPAPPAPISHLASPECPPDPR
jgi:hypothetical protein